MKTNIFTIIISSIVLILLQSCTTPLTLSVVQDTQDATKLQLYKNKTITLVRELASFDNRTVAKGKYTVRKGQTNQKKRISIIICGAALSAPVNNTFNVCFEATDDCSLAFKYNPNIDAYVFTPENNKVKYCEDEFNVKCGSSAKLMIKKSVKKKTKTIVNRAKGRKIE